MTMRAFVALTLVLALGAGACGASVARDEEPLVAARARDPRSTDPTAQRPIDPHEVIYGRPASSAKAPAPAPLATVNANEDESGPPKKVGARHILIQWMGSERAPSSVVRTRDQALGIAQQVLARAKAGDDFARLAVEYSDEPGAAARGGSLGRFGRGAMVPAFEQAVFRLKVGEISDIVETGFGFHIIQRTE